MFVFDGQCYVSEEENKEESKEDGGGLPAGAAVAGVDVAGAAEGVAGREGEWGGYGCCHRCFLLFRTRGVYCINRNCRL